MRLAGTSSWRLEAKDSQPLMLALFVRDAAGLAIGGQADDVPPLIGAVPDRLDVLDADTLRAAHDQWSTWWRQLLDLEFGDRQQHSDAKARGRQRIAEHQAICDPPSFEALADRPSLRVVARASFGRFQTWESSRPSLGRGGGLGPPLDWSVMKQLAEDVAFDRRVSLDAVQARVAILPVEGIWWRRVTPGAVLCSIAAANDRATTQALLRDAFDSYVMRLA